MTQYPPGQGPYGPSSQNPYGQGQYPPQYAPQYVPAYATPPVAASPRPTSVTVLAIIGIILGGLGTLCSPMAVVPFLVTLPGPKDPVMEAIKGDAGLMAWMLGSTALGFLMALVLLAASIAALKLREWARKTLVAYAALAVATGVLSVAITFIVIHPKIAAAIGNSTAARQAMFMQTVTTLGGSIVGLIFPAFLLFYMTRPHVKAAFAGQPPAAAPQYGQYGQYGQYPPPGAYGQ